jgi:hypothetical protein
MPKKISLKLCLLNCLIEKTREESENETLMSNPKSACSSYQGQRHHKQDFVPVVDAMRRDSEEAW